MQVKMDRKSKNTWENVVKDAFRNQERVQDLRKRRELKRYYERAIALIPIPLAIGIAASYTMYRLYGVETLVEHLLGWVIGLTIIATIIASIPRRAE